MSEKKAMEACAQVEEALRNIGILDTAVDVQLLDWKRSGARSGPRLTFGLAEDEDIDPFERATIAKGNRAGQLYRAIFIRIDGARTPPATKEKRAKPDKRPPNEVAKAMHVNGYFRNPRLWDAMEAAGLCTQEQRRKWCYRENDCCAPRFGLSREDCDGDVVAHHATSAALPAQGDGQHPRKVPDWYTVPLCNAHHSNWVHGTGLHVATRDQRQQLVTMAIGYTERWIKDVLKAYMGIESLSLVTVAQVEDLERAIDFDSGMLPALRRAEMPVS